MKKISLYTIAAASALYFTACDSGNNTQTEESSNKMEKSATTEETASNEMTVNIDLEKSKVMWKGEMVKMYSHEGTLNFSAGKIMMEGNNIVGGEFTVDMSTITPTDENYMPEDGKTPEKLVGHLSSDDFFAVENNPTASFKINKVEGNKAMGTLTIRGISNEETVEGISMTGAGADMKVMGTLTFDRTQYDVSFSHPMKEMVLSNDIVLNIELAPAMEAM